MSTAEWTLEVALDAAVDCIERHLPGYLSARLAEDALRARPLLNGHLPMPKVVTTGMIDDLAADWVTPAIFLNANSTSYQNYNASSLLDSQPRITATVLLAEGDVNTSEQRIYSNALSMYSDGVRFILSTIFPQDGGCDVGVNAATPDSVQYSPVVRPDGYSVWLRWSEVSVVWTQRVNNYWQTEPPTPPPWDPMTLEPLIWLDASDVSTMFVDSDGTVPVVASGDPVGRWRNKGTLGAAGDAVQTVSAQRPVFREAAGNPCIEFNGAGPRMVTGHTPTLPTSVWAHLVRTAPFGGSVRRFLATPTALPYFQVTDLAAGVNALYNEGSGGKTATANGPRSEAVMGLDLAQGIHRMWLGTVSGDGATPPASNWTAAGPLGMVINGDVACDYRGLLLFDRILTDEERDQLRAYLEETHGN